MLFWKRRLQRSSSSSSTATSLPTYRQNSGDAANPTTPPVDGLPLGFEEAGTIELQAQENDYVLEESALRVSLSPPPNYCPHPLTPPPSYTERPRTVQEQEYHQAVSVHPATPARVVVFRPAGGSAGASELAARQQARRRRRLRELQQQQLQFASSTDSSSSSASSCSELESGGSATRRQRRRRRGLRDAYCPDLLNACSLILQQPGSSDSSVGNFTATPPPPSREPNPRNHQEESFEYTSDYVEIDELLPLVAGGRAKSTPQLAMGQNLSLRRPRISLTWVLREQQQTQTAPQSQTPPSPQKEVPKESDSQVDRKEIEVFPTRTEPVPTQLDVTKKRYRVKQLPSGGEPLNGYATTPTAHQAPANGHLANQKFFSNQNLLDVSRSGPNGAPVAAASTKELLFVCTPQRAPRSDNHSEALLLARKRNEIRKKLASRLQQARSSGSQAGEARGSVTGAESLKCTSYSEPSLVAASEGGGVGGSGGGAAAPQQQRRHRHRKRRDRNNRVQRFGYEIHNVDEFLSRCSLATPGNIPVVLATASTLYQTRPGGYQLEIPLPLGMVVNAVFKNQNWLYVQTPHAEEGYVGYACCLPLGILPQQARAGSRNTPCWESNADVFPRPCGNMTDSEKEIRLRGGTRSDGARTPRSSKAPEDALKISTTTINNNNNHSNNNNQTKCGSTTSSLYGEQQVDKLYLRAASKPRLVEKAYAQLRSTRQVAASGSASAKSGASQDEYVTLQQKSVKKQPSTQNHLHHSQPAARRLSNVSYITNGHNGQHLHPKLVPLPPYEHKPAKNQAEADVTLKALRRQQEVGQRQTLVAINTDYITESIAVHKGEIVTLCECRESKDQRQWFYVRTRDGREGFIPAEVAGHGYL
ncbi:uncharacterized protein LOC108113584 isoform X2 [Drosophila eugracilis]|uniref:uncharacterized protein LOC108113584 isoform X2 n=1 Tax=Drosophila eugracilis TaxID=29029 RepID=UPI001BD99200|nr:uncharacterized protein LOC108113584 isoform X2 [Drosophila eugracilis]